MQNLTSAALSPHPGPGAGALINSSVYLLGIQVLLKGNSNSVVFSPWVPLTQLHFFYDALYVFRMLWCTGLTPAGVAHSWVLGSAVYSAFGLRAYLLVCLYFLLGSAVSNAQL